MTTENTILQWAESLPHSFETTSTNIFFNLAREYQKLSPDVAAEVPLETVVRGMEQKQTVSGAEALIQLQRAYKEGADGDFSNMAFVVALSFWIQARSSYGSGLAEQGWSFLTEAMYWLSNLLNKNVVLDLSLQGARKFEFDKNSSGGQASASKFAAIKKRIAEFVVETRPPDGWPSAASAAKKVAADKGMQEMREEVRLTEDRFEKTVQGWLAEMPEFLSAKQVR